MRGGALRFPQRVAVEQRQAHSNIRGVDWIGPRHVGEHPFEELREIPVPALCRVRANEIATVERVRRIELHDAFGDGKHVVARAADALEKALAAGPERQLICGVGS
jgi:hypothetical protein